MAALGGAAAAGVATVAVGVHGVADAFKAAKAAQESYADDAAAKAKAVESAQKGVTSALRSQQSAERQLRDAKRASQSAEEDLTRTRKDETRALEDLNRQVAKGKLDEEGAALAVAEAERDLQKARMSSTDPLEIADAQHRLNEALSDQQDVLIRNARTQQEANEANAKGVEGSDKVVAAKDRVAKANEGVETAQQAVADSNAQLLEATKALSDAQNQSSASAKKYDEALSKLSPNAQAFVQQMVALGPAMSNSLGKPVQDALFANLATDFASLATTSIPALREGMTGVAGAINNAGRSFASFMSQASSQDAIRAAFAGTRDVINGSIGGIQTLTQGLMNMTIAAQPAMASIGNSIGVMFGSLGSTLTQLANSGALTTLFQNFAGILASLGPTLSGLVNALVTMGNAAAPGIEALFNALGPALQNIAGPLGQLGNLFGQALASILPTLSQLISGLATGLQPVLPIIAQLLNSLGTALMPLIGPISQITQVFGTALVQAIDALAPAVGPLGTAFASLVNALAPILPLIAQVISMFVQALAPALTTIFNAFAPVIQQLVSQLQPIFQQIAPVLSLVANTIATVLTQALQALAPVLPIIIDAFMQWLQAIMPLIPSLMELVLAVLPVMVELINLLVPVIGKFADVLSWLATNVLGGILVPILQSVIGFLANDLGPIFTWLWQDVIQPAWTGIGSVFSFVWNSILKPIFGAFGEAIRIAAGILLTVLIAPAMIAWNLFGGAIKSVYNSLIKPIFEAFGDSAMWLWQNALKPAWDGIGAVISGVYDSVIKPTLDGIHVALDGLGDFFQFIWDKVISPAWSALGTGLKFVYDKVISPVFDGIKSALGLVKDAFKTAVDYIGKVWDGIKKVMADPINFVIDKILNNGIFAAWNKVAGFLQLPEIKGIEPIKLATGGYVSGAGGPKDDLIPAMLSNGEFVLNAATVSRIGVDNLNRINGGGTADGLASLVPKFNAGGEVEASLIRAHEFARSMDGRAYLMGGEAPGPTDCSGFMSAIADVVLGGSGHGRWWATTAFPKSQASNVTAGGQHWAGGLGKGFSIGVLGGADSGGANGHTAGTLTGAGKYPTINVESGGSHGNVAYGGPAAGADSRQFPTQYHLPFIDGMFESGGSGGGLFGSVTHWLRDKVGDLFEKPVRALEGLIPVFPGAYGATPKAVYHKIADATIDFVKGKASSEDGNAGLGVPGTGPVQDQVRQAFSRYGWGDGDQWAAAAWIIAHESSWNPTARNPESGAFGLAQFLGSTKDAYLPDENPNPGVQGDAMARYIRDRYGTPKAAQQFWMAHNWYDSGGIFPNNSIGINQSGKPEAVLTHDQWKLFTKFVELLGQGKLSEAIGSLNNGPASSPVIVVQTGNPNDPNPITPVAPGTQLTAENVTQRLQGIGSDFVSANVDQFLGDIGTRSSGGAVQELVKQIQTAMAQQIAQQLAQQRAQAAPFVGRR
jgi:phage-related protein